MALIKRTELSSKIEQLLTDLPKIFLFFGERYLCKKAADELQSAILKSQKGTVFAIDGDQEDAGQTLNKLMSYSLLPGLQIFQVSDTRLFHSKSISSIVWEKVEKAYRADKINQASKYLSDMYSLSGVPQQEWQPMVDLTDHQWQEMFGIKKPNDLGWTEPLVANILQLDKSQTASASLSERYITALDKGIPASNLLILSAETVDKRKKLFTYIKKQGLVIDCSVADGSSAAAQKVQKSVLQEMIRQTLSEFNKTIDPRALELFFERVGFHPVAVVMETEKLALYSGDRPKITLEDLSSMVGRSREDALFELTDHFGKRNLSKTLITLNHLFDNGMHGLAILATMRNYIRKLLVFRSIQLKPSPVFNKGMSAKQFQDSYLPALKEHNEWQDLLKGHPYALYMSFTKAAGFKCTTMKSWLAQILEAEFRLKGSSIPQTIVLEQLFVSMLTKKSPPMSL